MDLSENKQAQPTVAALLSQTAERLDQCGVFLGHGQDDVWDEAAYLVGHVIGALPVIGEEQMHMPVNEARQLRLQQLVEKRVVERVPAAYLVGEAWFAGVHLICDERALVPRSPIAELVMEQFRPWLQKAEPHILELCTGGGAIAAACARHLRGASIMATDIDAAALDLARVNMEFANCADRVQLRRADLFQGLPARRYDLIVSNPPYVPQARVDGLPPEYAHEPARGLVSGLQGLELPLRILAEAADFLQDDGFLVMEVGESAPALDQAIPDAGWIWLEFANGGEGVLLATAAQLKKIGPAAGRLLEAADGG